MGRDLPSLYWVQNYVGSGLKKEVAWEWIVLGLLSFLLLRHIVSKVAKDHIYTGSACVETEM